jgi:carboxyl-terminal processing protease
MKGSIMKMAFDRKVLLVVSAVLIVATISGALMGRVVAREGTYAYLKLFNEALYLIVHNYVQPIEIETVMEGAYRGMRESLDPGNEYLSPEEFQRASREEDRGPADVGLALSKRRGYVVVVSASPGSPAALEGIHTGDVVVTIDGRSTRMMGVWEASQALLGAEGSETTLILSPTDGTGRRTMTLTRSKTYEGRLTGATLAPDVGVIRLTRIRKKDAQILDRIIASLQDEGTERLLLDLRGCAADSLPEAIGMASLFIPEGPIVTVTDRYEGDKSYKADGRKLAWKRPMVVLMDEGTAGTCELLAAALRDVLGTPLLGEQTWGTGTLRRLLPLRNGDGVILAVGRFQSPSGKEWNGKGLEPDLEVAGEEGDEGDPQRQKAIDYLRGLSSTPSRSAA